MGAILAIASDAAAIEQALASLDAPSWSLLATAVAALGLWLWGRRRLSRAHAWQPVPARAAAFAAPTRSAGVAPSDRTRVRPRRPQLAGSSSLLRAPPDVGPTSPAPARAPWRLPPAPRSGPRPRPLNAVPNRGTT